LEDEGVGKAEGAKGDARQMQGKVEDKVEQVKDRVADPMDQHQTSPQPPIHIRALQVTHIARGRLERSEITTACREPPVQAPRRTLGGLDSATEPGNVP
jgi:hypothetical protein